MRGAAIGLLALLYATPVPAQTDRWRDYIDEASLRFAVSRDWIARVMAVESGGQTQREGHPIRSKVGAIGLMQLMPDTYADMRQLYNLGPDPDDPRDNILAGAAYLRRMYDRYGYPGLFAAYNAGPERYEASLEGQTLPLETRQYLVKLTRGQRVTAQMSPLFIVCEKTNSGGDSGLFVALNPPKIPEN